MMFDSKLVDKFGSIKTPFYYYDISLLRKTLQEISDISKKNNYVVHYAFKANTNDRILKTIKEYGLGADCVSGNEVKRALEIGFSPNHIVFAGVGKTDDEIEVGLNSNIFCFNCESGQELQVINDLAGKNNKKVRVALRLNPNVDAGAHHHTTTGLEDNKFGISLSELPEIMELAKVCKNIELIGIHFHIGSGTNGLTSFKHLCVKVNEIQKWFLSHNIRLSHVNVGGGLGVDYRHPDEKPVAEFREYFNIFHQFLERRPGQQVHFELGRSIVASCGDLITRVLYIKKRPHINFVIVDAGMNDLIRPMLYQAYHKIENISKSEAGSHLPAGKAGKTEVQYDIVGPICESTDCFQKAVTLPETNRGDLVAIRTVGAYGEVMSSNYNLREKAKALYSDELMYTKPT